MLMELNEFEELHYKIEDSLEQFSQFCETDGLKFASLTCWYHAPQHFAMLQHRLKNMNPWFEMNMNETQIQQKWKTFTRFEGTIIVATYTARDKKKCTKHAQTVASKLNEFINTINLSSYDSHIQLINCFSDVYASSGGYKLKSC